MRKAAVLFDLGNTLVAYYRKEEFAPILQQCVANVLRELQRAGLSAPAEDAAFAAALQENHEAADHRFSPLWPRLARIFSLRVPEQSALAETLCGSFMRPIFATARCYEDTIPVLEILQQAGIKTAIVSNSPWGSAPQLWREELHRLGLASRVNAVVMCGDVGWRKPAQQIFQQAATTLGVGCEDCIFVGDDIEWDVRGSLAAGMRPVLLDRAGTHEKFAGERIRQLDGLLARITAE